MLMFALFSQIFSNQVHRVLSLIGCFFCAAILCIMLNAEFIATMLIIIYMGAIAMLFLFVIMIIGSNDEKEINKDYNKYLYIVISIVFASSIAFIFGSNLNSGHLIETSDTSIYALGKLLYEKYATNLFFTGLALLAGLIGAILLTIEYKHTRLIVKSNNKKTTDLVYPTIKSGIDI